MNDEHNKKIQNELIMIKKKSQAQKDDLIKYENDLINHEKEDDSRKFISTISKIIFFNELLNELIEKKELFEKDIKEDFKRKSTYIENDRYINNELLNIIQKKVGIKNFNIKEHIDYLQSDAGMIVFLLCICDNYGRSFIYQNEKLYEKFGRLADNFDYIVQNDEFKMNDKNEIIENLIKAIQSHILDDEKQYLNMLKKNIIKQLNNNKNETFEIYNFNTSYSTEEIFQQYMPELTYSLENNKKNIKNEILQQQKYLEEIEQKANNVLNKDQLQIFNKCVSNAQKTIENLLSFNISEIPEHIDKIVLCKGLIIDSTNGKNIIDTEKYKIDIYHILQTLNIIKKNIEDNITVEKELNRIKLTNKNIQNEKNNNETQNIEKYNEDESIDKINKEEVVINNEEKEKDITDGNNDIGEEEDIKDNKINNKQQQTDNNVLEEKNTNNTLKKYDKKEVLINNEEKEKDITDGNNDIGEEEEEEEDKYLNIIKNNQFVIKNKKKIKKPNFTEKLNNEDEKEDNIVEEQNIQESITVQNSLPDEEEQQIINEEEENKESENEGKNAIEEKNIIEDHNIVEEKEENANIKDDKINKQQKNDNDNLDYKNTNDALKNDNKKIQKNNKSLKNRKKTTNNKNIQDILNDIDKSKNNNKILNGEMFENIIAENMNYNENKNNTLIQTNDNYDLLKTIPINYNKLKQSQNIKIKIPKISKQILQNKYTKHSNKITNTNDNNLKQIKDFDMQKTEEKKENKWYDYILMILKAPFTLIKYIISLFSNKQSQENNNIKHYNTNDNHITTSNNYNNKQLETNNKQYNNINKPINNSETKIVNKVNLNNNHSNFKS